MAEDKKPEVTIKKIVINLGRRELVLTTEEAQQLRAALNKLFREKVVKVTEEHHHHYPTWTWDWKMPSYITNPIYYQPTDGYRGPIGPSITCGGSGDNVSAARAISYECKGDTIQCSFKDCSSEVR